MRTWRMLLVLGGTMGGTLACPEKPAPVAVVETPEPEPPPPPPPPKERVDPERVDAALRAGIVSTCIDGKKDEKRAEVCACAADAFMRDGRVEDLRDLKSAGWNRDSLVLLAGARRTCEAPPAAAP